MPIWRLRDFRDDDLDAAIQIWDRDRPPDAALPVFPVSEVMAMARTGAPAVVAVVGDTLVGMAVAQDQGERAWITLVALDARWRQHGVGSALIAELERRLRVRGVRRIGALLAPGAAGSEALEESGYRARSGLTLYEKVEHLGASDAGLLAELGGRVLPQGLWDSLAGMTREKGAIERRIVLPLAEPALADRYGVTPPKSVILFGPPGTGKTSFAKAVASRLEWPFVELFPSRLAEDAPGGLATSLREAFADLAELETVLLFIDEVEEIAGVRSGRAVDPGHGVTNELLKLIPGFRDHDGRLLICATNSVRSLDPAFLRPGRFDYVMPVGPPDPAARSAIWRRYLGPTAGSVEMSRLVEASEMFTPADIESAAFKGSHAAFEREVVERQDVPATTEDYLVAVADTRPTLTDQAIREFREDIERYERR
ncbi:ATP-binding protein [Streptomyces fuscigenes]|uniref:ATP-binding protein n=1 Tax=Streptomyces fuscigenes TaxID=1528880 RepID=UPI001F48ED27|nr:bifunctional GNAT family N-acetyltransferase/ATP-binding protein [Streptomyces fuscigenes]MCF3965052.1 bifunctional GNAT family N-acetyltransferase/ATP-binding protein [Streptomyces fuscigenes]